MNTATVIGWLAVLYLSLTVTGFALGMWREERKRADTLSEQLQVLQQPEDASGHE